MANEESPSSDPAAKLESGFSAQFVTIAIALRIQLVEYYERRAKWARRYGKNLEGVEELEARRWTIVILIAALAESAINTFLSLHVPPERFDILDRASPVDKWVVLPGFVSSAYNFPRGSALHDDLKRVFSMRNAIMHAKPEVKTNGSREHKGNAGHIALLRDADMLRIARLPESLCGLLIACGGHYGALLMSDIQHELALHKIVELSQEE